MLKHALLATAFTLLSGPSYASSIADVFVIALENHNFTQPSSYNRTQKILGNPAAPFINSLVRPGNPNSKQVSYSSNYQNVPPQSAHSPSGAGAVHPSEPNYIWAEAGVAGPRNDKDPYPNNIVRAPSLSATLQAKRISWRSYQEDTDLATVDGHLTNAVRSASQRTVPLTSFSGTSPAYTNPYNGRHQYSYAAKHDPQVFFATTSGGNNASPTNPEANHYAPLQQLRSDLTNNTVAKYNWITPDQYNDMHTSLNGGFTRNRVTYTGDAANIAQGDNFLSIVVPQIEASRAFKSNGVIVIWSDETEGDSTSTAGFASTEIVISPLAKGNAYTNSLYYNHSSDLRTMQEIFGVDPSNGTAWLGGAANARDLSDLFIRGAISAAPQTRSLGLYDNQQSDLRTMQEILGGDPSNGTALPKGAASATDASDLLIRGAISTVPLPRSWALMATALIGLGLAGGFRRRLVETQNF